MEGTNKGMKRHAREHAPSSSSFAGREMTIQEETHFAGKRYLATWETGYELPPRDLVRQVSAVCFTPFNQIVMIGDTPGELHIPGGHPEDGERLDEALRREIREETCCEVRDMRLLGWQRVVDMDDASVHYQMRYCCCVEVRPFAPEHEVATRTIIDSCAFLEELKYGNSPIAAEFYRLALEANQDMEDSEPKPNLII